MTCTIYSIDTMNDLARQSFRIVSGSANNATPRLALGRHKFIVLRTANGIAVALGPYWNDTYFHMDIYAALRHAYPDARVCGGGYAAIGTRADTGKLTVSFWGSSGSYGDYDPAIGNSDMRAAIAASLGTDADHITVG